MTVYATAPVQNVTCANGDYWLNLQCEPCQPCPQCDPSMVQENEPCPNNPDLYNSGCGPDFLSHVMPVHCGDRICGTSEANGLYQDVDVYEVTLSNYDSLIWSVVANFNASIKIVDPLAPCGPQILYATATGNKCDSLAVGACLPPGTYWLYVQPWVAGVFCDLDQYTAEVRCFPCFACAPCPPGALIENEPCPFQGAYNSGCDFPTMPSIPVHCGMDICGTAAMQDFPDRDFYSITLTSVDSIVWCVTADFPVGLGIYSVSYPCPSMITYASTTGPACVPVCVSACLNPGTYWLELHPVGSTGFVCKPYHANVQCYPCSTPVDTCNYLSQDFEPTDDTCPGTTSVFQCGDTLCGRIQSGAGAPDRDWYNITVPACRTLYIQCFGNDTPSWYPFAAGLNPRISLWRSDCSTILNFDDSSGVGNDAFMISPCLEPGTYKLMVQGVALSTGPYILTMRCAPCACPCSLSCGTLPQDGEACPNLTGPDTYNGGCNTDPLAPPLGVLTCNTSFCATAFAMGGIKDYDWYRLTLTAPRRIRWRVTAEFPFNMTIYRPNPDCSNLVTLSDMFGTPCQMRQAFINCLAPGTYWFRVTPSVNNGVPCGEYTSRLMCGKCLIIDVVVNPVLSTDLHLSWSPDPTEPVFKIYRSPNPVFTPSPDLWIGSTTDTTFIDPGIFANPALKYFYSVTMEDPPQEP